MSAIFGNAEGLTRFLRRYLILRRLRQGVYGNDRGVVRQFQRFNQLPEETLFYPAHEYTAANLRFAEFIEPENPDIQAALRAAEHTPTLPVTLAHERKINPFLRVDLPQVRERVEELVGKQLDSGLEVFAALRELKNRFRSSENSIQPIQTKAIDPLSRRCINTDGNDSPFYSGLTLNRYGVASP